MIFAKQNISHPALGSISATSSSTVKNDFAKQNILHSALGSISATSSSTVKNDFCQAKYLTFQRLAVLSQHLPSLR
ncbi:hypothetical protein PO903_00705 [Paenibacillus sp. PK4536]|uniref:hypothetical protein n=1 Tax=Paenibacillus sp. PK4536 TaxID=3024576 RepID=UPI0023585D49|nr:hypothetical protein [Paenibacillus sp. PK4536]WIM39459.1 hypothetical protein PO903_00705 [Paenibacillus sp. PK4536]